MSDPKPLAGRRILEVQSAGDDPAVREAIAFCGRMLSDLGAEVLTGPSSSGQPFLTQGKTLSKHPEGRIDLALTGAGTAPGQERARVSVSMLPEGAGDIPVSEFTVMATGGLLDIVGDPDRAPLRLPGHQLARAAGLAAFTAASACLHGGQSSRAHVSLLDTAIWLNWKSLVVARENGRAPSRLGAGSEWQTVRCADGWMGLVYRQEDWTALKALVGNPRLDDPDLNVRAIRRQRAAEVTAMIEEHFLTMTRAEIMGYAGRNRIPLGAVLSPREVIDDAHSRARGAFVATPGGVMPRLPVKWNGKGIGPGQVLR
ncbi:hypothetical protein GCM10011360_41340 [Primorskyibacter flagellatus]|uniref:Uncharacterized protein n=1 Tax=Primorskyibacter flagellatus TaxID=1387277 RepID=A0A917AGM4_9RHOB|nr:CoA transferase [Primorskyibacter flagellatus]GGE50034.1 hypothetical protein GCM10011360_41340 [Primorskyibacter flagellatus]